MQAYRNRLERKRKELEKEAKEKTGVQTVLNTLLRDIKHVEMDLRDLMNRVSNHVCSQSFDPPFKIRHNQNNY